MADPKVTFAHEAVDIQPLWHQFSALKTASPKLWMDSYLAALAIAHGYTLVTLDNDFKQFANLNYRLI